MLCWYLVHRIFIIKVINVDRFNLILNKEKKFALKNIYEGIKLLNPSDEDIIITIDGDDWLYDSTVFDKVKNILLYE